MYIASTCLEDKRIFLHETPPKSIKRTQKRGVLQTTPKTKGSGDSRYIYIINILKLSCKASIVAPFCYLLKTYHLLRIAASPKAVLATTCSNAENPKGHQETKKRCNFRIFPDEYTLNTSAPQNEHLLLKHTWRTFWHIVSLYQLSFHSSSDSRHWHKNPK